jgi:polyisoprenoid-binding protein YceI
MPRRKHWIVALALVAPVAAAAAGQLLVSVDPEASEISFILDATAHEVHGVLAVESGEIRWNPDTGEATGRILVDAASADTGNDRRDEKMHSQVLESGRFPSIVFDVERIEGEIVEGQSSEVRVVGTLSLHGTKHPLTIDVEVLARGERAEAKASFEVPYVEWGLRDPSVFVLRVAKSVTVQVELAGDLTLSTAGRPRR